MSKKAEKQLRIATAFLTAAPAGEFDVVASDLEALTGNKSLVRSAVDAAFISWHHANCGLVPVGEYNVIICEEAKVAEGTYVNPYTQTLVKFDLPSKKFTQTADKAPGSNPLRAQLQQLLTGYVKSAYKSNIAVGVYDTKGGLNIVMRSSSISLKNYRTGNIIARYKLESSGKLSGTISVTQHYFETGNVMSYQAARMEGTIPPGDLAEALGKIQEFENQWLASYLEAFEWLSNEGMAKLRRKIPISGTKINWEAELRGLGGMATASK
jgi:capping protein alpha